MGSGITADQLHDDCLERTLDWLYAHDPTTLFAGIARQARQRFGVSARQVHVDTTSFSVSGAYVAISTEEAATDYRVLVLIFQRFEGISPVRFPAPVSPPYQEVAGLEPLYDQVLAL